MADKIPGFQDLPLRESDPPWSAWGLYGKDDELGMLNRLTPSIVLEASKEIKTGQRVSLNWAMDAQSDLPFFNRKKFDKEIIEKPPRCVNDDVWHFNTQCSTQWDGLRHFGYQKERKFYNGVTMEDIHGANKSNVLGIHNMSNEGIVGRGILLDYASWREKHAPHIPYEPFKSTPIRLEHLKACAEAQGTEIKFGDILIIRSGYIQAFNMTSREDLKVLTAVNPPTFSGVEATVEVLEWIWNHFSAVAGDQVAFECYPKQGDVMLHEVLLGGWGCPIGEMFDLEALSKKCQELGRWSFFVTSEVANVPGGVASPANILAIF